MDEGFDDFPSSDERVGWFDGGDGFLGGHGELEVDDGSGGGEGSFQVVFVVLALTSVS